MFLHIGNCQIIHRENTILSAGFDRHIGNGKSVIHGKICNAVPGKLHGLVKGTVHPNHADNM